MKRLAFYIFIAITLLGSCTKEIGNTSNGVAENECVLLLNMGLSPLDISGETKASSGNWIQGSIAMTNVAIAIFEHDSEERVYSAANYPFKLVSTSAPLQSAWSLNNFVPDPSKTYNLAFASNFCRTDDLKAFLETDTWSELMNPAPDSRSFRFTRTWMSDPTKVANKPSEEPKDINYPPVEGYGGNMYVNQWRSPILSGVFENLTLTPGGLNILGFKKDGTNYVPEVSLPTINSDLGTSLTDLPTIHDASDGEVDNEKRIMKISPLYSLVVVDGITNSTDEKLEITDIFMMNVPMCHHLFNIGTYHFGASDNSIKDAIGAVAFSKGKDLVSGFKPEWIDEDFKANTVDDNFARLLHYPASEAVSQSKFLSVYTENGNYYFKISYTSPMLDRLCVTKGTVDDFSSNMNGNWDFLKSNFNLKYITGTVRKAPFFLVSENDGYPNEKTKDENGDWQYLFATRLVIRGIWKETPSSPGEVVYYPIIVNGPNQAYTATYADDSQEMENNLVKTNRRYIYNITIKNKGVYNPWTPSHVKVELGSIELKVEMWLDSKVEIPEYIY